MLYDPAPLYASQIWENPKFGQARPQGWARVRFRKFLGSRLSQAEEFGLSQEGTRETWEN